MTHTAGTAQRVQHQSPASYRPAQRERRSPWPTVIYTKSERRKHPDRRKHLAEVLPAFVMATPPTPADSCALSRLAACNTNQRDHFYLAARNIRQRTSSQTT